jgi:hypothetical protein
VETADRSVEPDEDHLPEDVRAQLEKLKQFRERDMITEEEFLRRREKLLAQSRP